MDCEGGKDERGMGGEEGGGKGTRVSATEGGTQLLDGEDVRAVGERRTRG